MVRSLCLVFIVFASASTFAQEIVKGIVVDSATFAPLPYVNVQVKNTLRGTTTDLKGSFGIIASEADTLVFTLLGYSRLELPLFGYEPSVIRLAERPTLLQAITVDDYRLDNPYAGMFDDQNLARLKQSIPFYYSKTRKDKIKAGRWREESMLVQTYVDVVINDPETKKGLMKKHQLNENQYYEILTRFNEKYYSVMYYLTSVELTSLLTRFFEMENR